MVGPAGRTQVNQLNGLQKGGDEKAAYEAIKLFNARSRPS
jgi:hypothetical protein